jgi:hypothetical protein
MRALGICGHHSYTGHILWALGIPLHRRLVLYWASYMQALVGAPQGATSNFRLQTLPLNNKLR